MVGIVRRTSAALLCAMLVGAGATAGAADRPPPQILAELDAIRMPAYDPSRQAEPGYREKMERELVGIASRRDTLIYELYRVDPNNNRLPQLMQERWRRNPPIGPNEAKFQQEIDDVLTRSRNEGLRSEALFARAQADLLKSRQTGKLEMAGVERFLKTYPTDERGALLLYMGAFVAGDEKVKTRLEDRILHDYPRAKIVDDIRAGRRQSDGLGKPFDLAFNDAITGKTVSMKELKGKVVVLDFWATWCPPCVSEMPHLKELYQKYHDRGVEFIGVSLDQPRDQGGLDSLKSFVQKNEIPWPQFYEGKPDAREFTVSWGVNLLPTAFVVDAEGKLYSVQARGKLDVIIPELLAKRPAQSPAH